MFNKNILLNNSESSFPVTINFYITYNNKTNKDYTLNFKESDSGFDEWYELNQSEYDSDPIQQAICDYYTNLDFTHITNVTTYSYTTTSDKIITIDSTGSYIKNERINGVEITIGFGGDIKEFEDGGIHGGAGWPWSIIELSNFIDTDININIEITDMGESPF